MKNNVSTKSANHYSDLDEGEMIWKELDEKIFLETQRRISQVPESKGHGISTACFIDGEFVLVSDYDISEKIEIALENA
jgi:hypothetical protein